MASYELGTKRPTFGRDVFVADSSAVIADVTLGDESSVWFGAVLRGDYAPIRLGSRTNVQDNAVVHIASHQSPGSADRPTLIGDDVTVGHAAILHACTVGARCLVGMGSILLDGVVVGDESFIAAGTLITPNTIIPPRSFVLGRPSKVIRNVTDEEVTSILHSALNYAAFARDFREQCKRA